MGRTKLPNFLVFSQANATAIAVAVKLLEEPNEVPCKSSANSMKLYRDKVTE